MAMLMKLSTLLQLPSSRDCLTLLESSELLTITFARVPTFKGKSIEVNAV
jgi:hypothetical protein